MLRSSDFGGDDNNNRQTDRLLYPCACAWGNYNAQCTCMHSQYRIIYYSVWVTCTIVLHLEIQFDLHIAAVTNVDMQQPACRVDWHVTVHVMHIV